MIRSPSGGEVSILVPISWLWHKSRNPEEKLSLLCLLVLREVRLFPGKGAIGSEWVDI